MKIKVAFSKYFLNNKLMFEKKTAFCEPWL